MGNIINIAAMRNLLRYRRRTLLTSLLITLGVMAVLLFVAVSGAFKSIMIGQITDSMMGHLQVHKRGYVASMGNLPLQKGYRSVQLFANITARDLDDEGFTLNFLPRVDELR